MKHIFLVAVMICSMSVSGQIEPPYNPDVDNDGVISVTDLLELFPLFGQPFAPEPCPEVAIAGCTDPEATNFNPEATVGDGSCEYSQEAGLHSCGAENVHNVEMVYGSVNDIDGNIYLTVVIENQEWMAENLVVQHYANGNPIVEVGSSSEWSNLNTGAWCFYENNALYECPYGKLYNWYAVADVRGLCPVGWHVPSLLEWNTLIENIGGEIVAGGKMKTSGEQYWLFPNGDASNSTGFSGLPGGSRNGSGSFNSIALLGRWWSSTSQTGLSAFFTSISNDNGVINTSGSGKKVGYSVRCIKD